MAPRRFTPDYGHDDPLDGANGLIWWSGNQNPGPPISHLGNRLAPASLTIVGTSQSVASNLRLPWEARTAPPPCHHHKLAGDFFLGQPLGLDKPTTARFEDVQRRRSMAEAPDEIPAASRQQAASSFASARAVGNATIPFGTASGSKAPPGHALRRVKTTVDDLLPTRRRSLASRSEASFEGLPPRRSSNFSDYSSEARAILNPQPQTGMELLPTEASSLASLSLAFALLPAITGALFKNGHVVVTDIMLLGLAGIFLHWSVTQPWYVGQRILQYV